MKITPTNEGTRARSRLTLAAAAIVALMAIAAIGAVAPA
ncbi:MAG: hypothetical protein QOE87_3679, partial [Gaiellales bacterium]|nr:hypothetical protein [Gaiellales bacterium]